MAALHDVVRDLVRGGLEVVEQIELEIIDEAARNLVGDAILVRILVGARGRRRFQAVQRTVEHHARGRDHATARFGSRQFGIDGLQSHLVIQRADDEFANRDLAAVREKRPHAQIRIDADHARRIDGPVRQRDQTAVEHALAGQRDRDRRVRFQRRRQRLRPQIAQVARNFVGEHLLQAEPEEMRGVAAIGSGGNVAARACRATRPSVACRATVGHSRADREIGADVAAAVGRQ